MPPSPYDAVERTLAHHRRGKHHPQRFARSAGYLDWAIQSAPFRVYAGAPRVELPLTADALDVPYRALFVPGAIEPQALELRSIAAFFELALGLTAWKEYEGSRWALRSDPSSGNLCTPPRAMSFALAVPLAQAHLSAGLHPRTSSPAVWATPDS